MKIILVTPRLLYSDKGELFEALAWNWHVFFHSLGFLSLPLPLSSDPSVIMEKTGCAGIVLSGGNDLSVINSDPLSNMRDEKEYLVVETALRRHLPVFGICRGMQFLAHFFGSTLARIDGHAGTRHAVTPVSGETLLGAPAALRVNSFHNWVVDETGPDLRVAARAEDGSIEAIVHRKFHCAGIMWHPERETTFVKNDVALVQRFFSERHAA